VLILSEIGRILRYLSSKGMITEPGEDIFAPSKVTKALAVKEAQGSNVYQCVFRFSPDENANGRNAVLIAVARSSSSSRIF
jgi:hypothetical protein